MSDCKYSFIKDWLSLLKIRTVLLMTFCACVAFVIAAEMNVNWLRFSLLLLATWLSVGGSCMLNNYLDRDIDKKMVRTKSRPLPAERLRPETVFLAGFLFLIPGLLIALYLNFLTFIFGLLAAVFYLVLYTYSLKRRNALNILFGSPAGGLPVLAGWTAATGALKPQPLFLAIIVILWIPSHIWTLALSYSWDYRTARIPMLPVVAGFQATVGAIILSLGLMFALTIYLYIAGFFGALYLAIVLPIGIAVLGAMSALYFHTTRKRAFLMFKLSSPYLFIVFLAILLDYWW